MTKGTTRSPANDSARKRFMLLFTLVNAAALALILGIISDQSVIGAGIGFSAGIAIGAWVYLKYRRRKAPEDATE